jgi:transcriptional regulator with XRE-family HTH domain
MSPFSTVFRDLRIFCGLRQVEFATQLGYEQSYISAIELGIKGPPTSEFIDRLVQRLDLDEEWQKRLLQALDESHRKIVLHSEASEDLYKMFNELRRQLDKLHPAQVELMQLALRLPDLNSKAQEKPSLPPRRQRERQAAKGTAES